MIGGNVATCAAHPASSCCLKPCSSVWNILFSSGDGWFHLIIELQNHNKLCPAKKKKISAHSSKGKCEKKQHQSGSAPSPSPQGSPARACIARGTRSPSPHCRESRTAPGTTTARTRADAARPARGASARCVRWTPLRSRAGCAATWGAARSESAARSTG